MTMLTQSHGNEKNDSNEKLALFGALCLFLSAVEYMIPKPFPFMRIGLANLPLMLALDFISFHSFFILMMIKIFGQAIITGTLFSYIFLFSLAGTVSSAFLMFGFRRLFGKKHITFIGLGIIGAMVSNSAQILMAKFFIFKDNIIYIIPPFLVVGLISGIVLGIFCEVFSRRSIWFSSLNTEVSLVHDGKYIDNTAIPDNEDKTEQKLTFRVKRKMLYDNIFNAKDLFITGIVIMPAMLFIKNTEFRVFQFLFFWFLAWLSGKKIKPFLTLFIIAIIVLFNLIIPYGHILFSAGKFIVTEGSLKAGLRRAVTLQALVMLSKVCIKQDLKIPGSFGKLLGESLKIFNNLLNNKYRITVKNIITDIDKLLLEAENKNITKLDIGEHKTTAAGYVILCAVILISWLPWFFLK